MPTSRPRPHPDHLSDQGRDNEEDIYMIARDCKTVQNGYTSVNNKIEEAIGYVEKCGTGIVGDL